MKYLSEFDLNLRYHFSEILNTPLAKPYWVYISLTHNCNFNCQMCGVKKILRGHELDIDVLKRSLKEIAGWGSDCVVMLTGGEIFLRKDIFEIIGYASSLGINIEAVSNGSQINNPQFAKKIIDSGLKNIAISLDGANSKTHDYIRGVDGAHRKAMDAIGYLCQEKRIKGAGPQISVWTTIMKENVEELYEIIALVKSAGVECLVYHPVIVNQDDMQNTIKSGLFWIGNDNIGALKQQIDKIAEHQKKDNLIAFLHDPYLWLGYFQGTLRRKDWRCNPFVFVDIGPDGFVRSCGPAFGNIKEMSLNDCLQTKDAKKARERMRACPKPCLQTCWAWPQADHLDSIVKDFITKIDGSCLSNTDKKRRIKEAAGLLTKYEQLLLKNHKTDGR